MVFVFRGFTPSLKLSRTGVKLQRGLSIFPDGLAGLGLLLLRVAAGGNLLWYSCGQLALQDAGLPALVVPAVALASGLSLLTGYRTPIGCVLGAGTSAGWVLASRPITGESRLSSIFATAIEIALLCLGPGAFSLDALRYGRHEIIIPPKTRDPEE